MLFIKSLSLKNFKNIESADFSFSKINLFEGETGEGKTAIVQALALILCNHIEGKMDEYIRWGSKEFNISCGFSYKNVDYKYVISCNNKGTTKRELNFPDNVYKQSDAYKYIAENILDPHLTLYSSISEQGKTASILFESPAKSLETLKKIFKIDLINDRIEEMKSFVKEQEKGIDILNAEKLLLENKQFEYQEIPKLPDVDITKLDEMLVQFEKDKREYENQSIAYELYQSKLRDYNDVQKNKVVLKKEIDDLVSSTIKLKERLVDQVSFDQEKYIELNKFINDLRVKISECERNKLTIQNIDKKIEKLSKDVDGLNQQLRENRVSRIEKCLYTIEDLKNNQREIISKSKELNLLEVKVNAIKLGECPIGLTCNNDNFKVEDKEKLFLDLETVKVLLEHFENEGKLIETKIREHENSVNENNLLQQKVNNIKQSIDSKNREISDLANEKNFVYYNADECSLFEKSLLEKENEIFKLDELKEEYKKINEFNYIIQEKVTQSEEILNKKNAMLSMVEDIKEPKRVEINVSYDKDVHDKIKNDIIQYKNIQIRIDEIKGYNSRIKTQQDKNYRDIEGKLNDIVELQKNNRILSESAKLLGKNFSSYLIDQKTKYINLKMDEFFQRAYNGKYRIKFEQSENKIGFYYSMDNENWYSTITLSGFERQLFSCSFRLALSTIQNLGVMILDEIDSDASLTKSLSLYQNLLNEEKLNQVFCISHNDTTKEFISNLNGSKVFSIENGNIV